MNDYLHGRFAFQYDISIRPNSKLMKNKTDKVHTCKNTFQIIRYNVCDCVHVRITLYDEQNDESKE